MNHRFHNISIMICPQCGFSYRTTNLNWRNGKRRKRICPVCGYKFTVPDITPGKFDKKIF